MPAQQWCTTSQHLSDADDELMPTALESEQHLCTAVVQQHLCTAALVAYLDNAKRSCTVPDTNALQNAVAAEL